ncbi:MAG TPA: M20 family metallo-hydrolase [Candidatus Acidoferrum sp.]|nr:M20 family metallo-hydrolase [Candidatus Acidoferrum sp.]
MKIHVDSQRLQREIEELARISEDTPPAVTRVLFSEADLRARKFVKGLCEEAGLAWRHDAVGNQFARLPGQRQDAAPVATGSHIDAIPNAGKYDGVVGVLGAIEALRALQRAGFRPQHPIELIVFTAEEPTRFGIGCVGSRLMSGVLSPGRAADLKDEAGQRLEDLRKAAGFTGPLDAVRLKQGAYAGFIELHIEQGPLLEQEGLAIGIVEKIAAPSTLRLRLTGVGGHAGGVLMPDRHDALLAGAEIALAVEAAARGSGSPDTVGTTGVFRIQPGAVNSVPCAAWLEVDLRDTQLATRDGTLQRIERAAQEACKRRGVALEMERLNADPPAICDPGLIRDVTEACKQVGASHRRMISRAYHDTLFMAQLCPATMIFIPCRGGFSHRPDEYASPEHIETGVRVLAGTLAAAAGTGDLNRSQSRAPFAAP